MPSLELEAVLTPSRFAEVGRSAGAFPRADGRLIAVTSELDRIFWYARALYEGHRVLYRVSIYASDLGQRLATFERARYPIHDVAFHPSEPVVAIGCGSYDGGYAFEGDLWIWNFETDEARSVLAESREVMRCAFTADGALDVLLRPRDEDEYVERDPFKTWIGGRLDDLQQMRGRWDSRLASFEPVDPEAFGLGRRAIDPHEHWRALAPDHEPRGRVWDVEWDGPESMLVTHDRCSVERWTRSGRTMAITDCGRGVALLRGPRSIVVHTLEAPTRPEAASCLFTLDVDRLVSLARFDRAVLASIDRSGRILCRDASHPHRDDMLVDVDGRTSMLSLGHYDCFNHHLRIDGEDDLFFLRGTPASGVRAKMLCAIDASGRVREVAPWDDARHLMCGTACMTGDETLIRSYYVHHPHPGRGDAVLDAIDLATGRARWSEVLEAPATTLVPIRGRPWLVCATTAGSIRLVDARTGESLDGQKHVIDGGSVVVLSLDERDGAMVAGTTDGRILLLRVVE
jgi:hypothetical protein